MPAGRVPKTVLVVEDHQSDVRLLEYVLGNDRDAYLLDRVDRLSAALEWLRRRTPDVVLLDLNLPDSRGVDTLVVLRTHAPRVPIVVLTGHGPEEGPRALRSGAGAYLVKEDLQHEGLRTAIDAAINRQTTLNEVQAPDRPVR